MSDAENNTAVVSTAFSSGNLPTGRMGIIRYATEVALSKLTVDQMRDAGYTENVITDSVYLYLGVANGKLPKGLPKYRIPQELLPVQIAEILSRAYPVVGIMTGGTSSDPDYDLLALYMEEGDDVGIYVTSEEPFRILARSYHYGLSTHEFDEMMSVLRDKVPRVKPCSDRNLIAVNNGIFDYAKKELISFSPEYVFLSKSRVNYDPAASNAVIHNDEDGTDWDVESWMSELSDDPAVVNTLWEVIGAIIRPLNPWNISAWFYSETGNNGKGTLCELMRQICGEGTYASIPLADFGKDFALEPLTHSSAIIVDENDVGTFIDKAANLKAVVTGDVIPINRKFKQIISYKFRGFMVQCLNEMPRIKDKSDSFFRRQLFIPFEKCFTGQERKYIKNDYLRRKDVLEYVLKRVLTMNYDSISVPDVCKRALNEYKSYADPVRNFLEEHMDLFQWDLLPYSWLYDCYREWYSKTSGSDRNMIGQQKFVKEVRRLCSEVCPGWAVAETPMHPGNRMSASEPLIDEYHLKEWMNPLYMNGNPKYRCCPVLKNTYRGIYRINPVAARDDDSGNDDD